MADLVNITAMRANNGSPLIHLYKNSVVLNRRALTLLELSCESENGYICIKHLKMHKDRLYISAGKQGDYPIKRLSHRGIVYSTVLSKAVAEQLQGYGTYRICPDDIVTDDKDSSRTPHYAIFFKKLSMRN